MNVMTMKSDKKPYSKPILNRTLTIHTLQAQRILDRIFKKLVSHLYAIDVILPVTTNRQTSIDLESNVLAILKAFHTSIETEIASTQETLANQKCADKIDYSHIKHFDAKISSPSIGLLADIICSIDILVMLLDRLWLATLLSNQQRATLHNRLEVLALRMMKDIENIMINPPSSN